MGGLTNQLRCQDHIDLGLESTKGMFWSEFFKDHHPDEYFLKILQITSPGNDVSEGVKQTASHLGETEKVTARPISHIEEDGLYSEHDSL